MNTVNVGGINITQIGLGTFPLRGDALHGALTYAINNGYGLIDTAYRYHNEVEIGSFLATQDVPSVVVQTKFSEIQLSYKKFWKIKYGRKTTKDAIEGSMDRLQKKCLDIYLLHSPSRRYVDFYSDLIRFREQNKVKVIGVCQFGKNQLQDIKNKCGEYPAINQIEVHPFYSNKHVIGFCKEHGIAVEARSIFTHGDALNELIRNELLLRIAEDHKKTVPQIILRWIVQQGLIAIVKSGNKMHIQENSNVFDFNLSDKEMEQIDSLNKNTSFGCVSNR